MMDSTVWRKVIWAVEHGKASNPRPSWSTLNDGSVTFDLEGGLTIKFFQGRTLFITPDAADCRISPTGYYAARLRRALARNLPEAAEILDGPSATNALRDLGPKRHWGRRFVIATVLLVGFISAVALGGC